MKKLIIFLIPFLLLGCMITLNLNDNITEIKYNDIYIDKDDFKKVINLINKNYNKIEKNKLKNKLTIKSKKNIYYFSLNNKYLEYQNKVAYNDKLNIYLHNLTKKYTDKSFFTIDYMKNYEANDEKAILLDKTSNYIIINLNQKVINFKINEIEKENDNFKDVDLIYSKKNVNKNKIVIRKSINYTNPDIRISFDTKYNYHVSIIPAYNDKQVMEFKIKFDEKKNSNGV